MKRLIALAAMLSLCASAHAQLFPGWSYNSAVTVDNTANASTLTDYQVRLTVDTASLIADGQLNADGSDLRFADGAVANELCFWVESGLNSASTVVWVRVPSVPASSTVDIQMVHGNPDASAAGNADCVFDLFEDFSTDLGVFADAGCGSMTPTVAGGEAQLSWSSSGLVISSTLFPITTAYVAEADVTAASGTWPGVYWTTNDASAASYAILINSTQARISEAGGGGTFCSGHNWASTLETYTGVAGVWSIAWPENGVQVAEFPTVGTLTATSSTHNRDDDGNTDLRLMMGGISSGTGTMNVNWVRARQYTDTPPSATVGDGVFVGEELSVPVDARWAMLLLMLGIAAVGVRRLL